MDQPTLEKRVLTELLMIRKSREGVSVALIARADTICQLLGAGDPYVAYNRLEHRILDSELDVSVRAAAASLGFASSGKSHLERLDEFGQQVFLDQRQVRRYSDKGINTLARLIATNWPTETVPQLTAVVVERLDVFELHIATKQLMIVEMREPTIELLIGSERKVLPFDHVVHDARTWREARRAHPYTIAKDVRATTLVVVWRGELWPKFDVIWQGVSGETSSETLGNKLILRLEGRTHGGS